MSIEAMKRWLEALEKCRYGFEYTRQYVGYETLPAIKGWSWYDGDVAAQAAIEEMRQAIEQAEQAQQKQCLMGGQCKHGSWCSEVYCQEHCEFVEQAEQAQSVVWDASAPLVVHPHPAFQNVPPKKEWVGLTDDDLRQIILAAVGVAEAKLKEKNT